MTDADILVSKFPDEVRYCLFCSGTGWVYLHPNSPDDLKSDCECCDGRGFIEVESDDDAD